MKNKNYYQVLGLQEGASLEEIKKAYRLYATKFHPDKRDGDVFFKERFQEIKEAYEILIDLHNGKIIYPQIVSFTASKHEILEGDWITIRWETINATDIRLFADNGYDKSEYQLSASGTKRIHISKLESQVDFNLMALGTNNISDNKTIIIKKGKPKILPQIISFSVSNDVISEGDFVTLTWETINAIDVTLRLDTGYNVLDYKLPVSGNKKFKISKFESKIIFELIAKGENNSSNKKSAIVLKRVPPPKEPIIHSFTSTNYHPKAGEHIIVNWNVSNADNIVFTRKSNTEILENYQNLPKDLGLNIGYFYRETEIFLLEAVQKDTQKRVEATFVINVDNSNNKIYVESSTGRPLTKKDPFGEVLIFYLVFGFFGIVGWFMLLTGLDMLGVIKFANLSTSFMVISSLIVGIIVPTIMDFFD